MSAPSRELVKQMTSQTRFAILGLGNGGHAFAGHLSLLGYPVRAWDIDPQRIEAINQTGTITVDGELEGVATPELVTATLPDALERADVVLMVVPTVYQASLAQQAAPYLSDEQTLLLNPGATGGALEVNEVLRRAGSTDVVVAETNNLLYACRSPRPGAVTIKGIKKRVDIACLPATATPRVSALLAEVFPQFRPVPSVLSTSIGNINAMMHPLPTLLNAGRCDTGDPFEYYYDGVTPRIAALVEDLDHERQLIAKAYEVEVPTLVQWYSESYTGTGDSLYNRVQSNSAYADIPGPISLDTRFLFEDVATGLVPLSELASAAGVATPLIDAVVQLASALLDTDFRTTGRTLARLGFNGMTLEEICAATK